MQGPCAREKAPWLNRTIRKTRSNRPGRQVPPASLSSPEPHGQCNRLPLGQQAPHQPSPALPGRPNPANPPSPE